MPAMAARSTQHGMCEHTHHQARAAGGRDGPRQDRAGDRRRRRVRERLAAARGVPRRGALALAGGTAALANPNPNPNPNPSPSPNLTPTPTLARLVPRDALGALGAGGEEAAEEIEAARVAHLPKVGLGLGLGSGSGLEEGGERARVKEEEGKKKKEEE